MSSPSDYSWRQERQSIADTVHRRDDRGELDIERTGFPARRNRAALGHQDQNEIRRAYNRASYWPERVELMQAWAECIDQLKRTPWRKISLVRRMGGAAASPTIIDLFSRSPASGICDPSIDVGFSPAGAVDADPDLRRERALGDLAVEGGPRQSGAGENGLQANDTV